MVDFYAISASSPASAWAQFKDSENSSIEDNTTQTPENLAHSHLGTG